MEQVKMSTQAGSISRVSELFAGIMDNITLDDDDTYELDKIEKEKQAHYESCGIGAKYLDKRIDDFNAYNDELKSNLETVKEFIDDVKKGASRTLWMCGTNGSGKTMLGGIIARELYGHYAESSIIEDEIEQTKNFRSDETLIELRKRYSKYPVLVIDEVARFPSDNEKRYLFKILNDRYNNDKSTVIITNLDRVELRNYLGRALVDRFVETCTSMQFTSDSYRENERNII